MTIRVVRILEYLYENDERAAMDMARWTLSVDLPKNGSNGAMRMKSATLPFDALPFYDGKNS